MSSEVRQSKKPCDEEEAHDSKVQRGKCVIQGRLNPEVQGVASLSCPGTPPARVRTARLSAKGAFFSGPTVAITRCMAAMSARSGKGSRAGPVGRHPQSGRVRVAIRAALALLFLACADGSAWAADDPNRALALLRAVENARLAVLPSSVELEHEYRSGQVHNRTELVLWFQDDFVRCEARGNTKSVVVRRRGELLHFDGKNSSTIRDPAKALADVCFDPRVLGISAHYLVSDTVHKCVAIHDSQSVRLVGREEVAGIMTNHVEVIDAYRQRREFWIEEAPGWPVHKFRFQAPGSNSYVISLSRFDTNVMPPGLPVEVTSTMYDLAGRVMAQDRLRVTRATVGIVIEPEKWELAGLGMPVGTPVADLRIKQRVGYWNGHQLTKDFPRSAKQPTSLGVIVLGCVVAGAIMVVTLSIVFVRRRR